MNGALPMWQGWFGKVGMSVPLVSKAADASIPLLEADNLEGLLEWVPSHKRKFSELSAVTSFPGWANEFAREGAYRALSELLNLGGGLVFAEDLCRRAGIRTINQAIARRAQAAAKEAGLASRTSGDELPEALANAGCVREAAWLLWQTRGARTEDSIGNFSPWVRSHPDILSALGLPTSRGSRQSDQDGLEQPHDVLRGVREALAAYEPDDPRLPQILRDAANRLTALAARRHADESVRKALHDAIEAVRARIGEAHGAFDAEALAAFDVRTSDPTREPIEVLRALVDRAGDYAAAAEAWREAFDALQRTRDYPGVGVLDKRQEQAWLALRDRLSEGTASAPSDGEASVDGEETADTEPPAVEKEAADAVVPARAPDAEPISANEVSYDAPTVVGKELPATETAEPSATSRHAIWSDATEDHASLERSDVELGHVGPLPDGLLSEDELVYGASDAQADVGRSLATAAARAVASALAHGRYGLALQVARSAQAAAVPLPFEASVDLLEALVSGLVTGQPRCDRASEVFGRKRDALMRELMSGVDTTAQLLVFSASLRPALFAIEAGAEALLRHVPALRGLGEGLHALVLLAVEVARTGEIQPEELAELRDHLAPQRELRAIREEMGRFYDDALRRTIKFHRATIIWTSILRVGAVHKALRAVVEGAADAPDLVSAALDVDLADLDRLISAADRAAVGGRKVQPLTAGARSTLRDWIEDLSERLRAWQRASDSAARPEVNRYGTQNRESLRRALRQAERDLQVIGEATGPSGDPDRLGLGLAAQVSRDAVASVLRLFDSPDTSRLTLEMHVGDDLLLLPTPWRPADAGSWPPSSLEAFFAQAEASAEAPRDYRSAFERALSAGHLPQAAQARERLAIEQPDGRDEVDARFEGERDRQMEVARTLLGTVRKRLNDLLGADDRQVLSRDLEPDLDKLDKMLHAGDPQIDLADWRGRVDEIVGALDDASSNLLGPLHERVNRLEESGHSVSDLRKMEELRDLTTLAEHIEAYEKGATPPDPPSSLLEAFSQHLSLRQERRPDLPSLQRAVAQRQRLEEVDYSTFDDGQLETASTLLQAWRDLRQNDGQDSGPQLRRLFNVLLTSVVDVKQAKGSGVPGHYALKTPVYADREECVAPAFGSVAEGRYDVILVESKNIGSGIEPAGLKNRVGAPTFFVMRAAMQPAARRQFMVQVRSKGANPSCGLIDETLILFLATRPMRRRSDLFGLALAMGVVQPYSDTAQQTSPEMFFGRSDELRELWDPNGSCLVYGGRQLGKTALLRQIELRHRGSDQIVIYGDQMAEGFGDGRSAFWRWIGKAVQARGLSLPTRPAPDDVRAAIRTWLADDGVRRVLFLIDEADAFLRAEIRNGFKVLVEVRELMRVTNRRCKFVFAGLHDVQRLARTPNSPLLHFGNPIRVGPLMGKDLFEARSMVEQPMAAAGYAFGRSSEEGRALVGRALSEVGYYPSLMQTFGLVLINRLNGRASTRIPSPLVLPIRMTEAELNEALEDNSFRDNVRSKFDNTLNLDPRYRLIAYLVLLGTQESADREDARPGMSIAEIQRDAMFWWSQGFAEDSSNSAFEGLLKEMEGLGVLVGLRDGRYAIRSARIAAMLGTLQEVGDRVQELADQPYRMLDDTGSLRRLIAGAPSPLTFRQEGVLLETRGTPAITVALSSQALGLGLVSRAVEELVRDDDQLLVLSLKVASVRELERAISTVATRMRDSQRQRGLLVAHGPWLGREAVEAGFGHPEVRRAQRASTQGVRVILLPTMIDWLELEEEDEGDRLWNAALLSLATLQEGGLREWVGRRTSNFSPVPGAIERLRSATGGFTSMLGALDGATVDDLVANARMAADVLAKTPDRSLAQLGLDDHWLRTLADFVRVQVEGRFEATDRDAITTLMAESGIRSPARGLSVLERLGIVERDVDPQVPPSWQLNPLAARLLSGDDPR